MVAWMGWVSGPVKTTPAKLHGGAVGKPKRRAAAKRARASRRRNRR